MKLLKSYYQGVSFEGISQKQCRLISQGISSKILRGHGQLTPHFTGLLIFSGKKSKISRHFQGQIRGKIGRFRGIFAGKKSKFAQKSAHFAWFSLEKSQNSQKNRPISRDFSGKSQISKDFRGKFLEKSADFTGNFWGKLRQETISKKQPISLDVFGKFR